LSFAIDFGTSNTVIARWNPAITQPEIIGLPGLSFRGGAAPDLIPSLVYVENAAQQKVWVGQQVRDRGLDISHDPRFFQGFKRGIGASVPGFMPELDGQVINFEQVGEWFLKQLLHPLQQSYPDLAESLVLTVPVNSFEAYRHWLSRICQDLEIEQIRILDEPTAAALGYGMADQEILLVLDFGGGTLDLSLIQLDSSRSKTKPLGFILKWGEKRIGESQNQPVKTARVLAKSGQNLGGTDLDHWLVEHFSQTTDLAINRLTTRLAERLKIQLSQHPQATEVYFNAETFDSIELSLDRTAFEQILHQHQFFARLDESMAQVLQQARRQGIEIEDINAVLLVGGSTQIPAVKTWMQQYFDPQKIVGDRPFEAIAQGALQLTQGIQLQDFLYHSYGIRYWDRRQNCHNWHPLIPAGQSYPMQSPVELVLGASVQGQPSIELIIGELGHETVDTEVFFDGDANHGTALRLVTRQMSSSTPQVQPLNDREGARSIAQLTPPGDPGQDRIKVLFMVDRDRSLRMTVDDLLTEERLLDNKVVAQLR
jgi:molecular chaperone DnaK (HSP70)